MVDPRRTTSELETATLMVSVVSCPLPRVRVVAWKARTVPVGIDMVRTTEPTPPVFGAPRAMRRAAPGIMYRQEGDVGYP